MARHKLSLDFFKNPPTIYAHSAYEVGSCAGNVVRQYGG